MQTTGISLNDVTLQNVHKLSEKEVFDILFHLICNYPKSERLQYTNILKQAFDFNSIKANSHNLKKDMIKAGYQFYDIPYNEKLIMAIRAKRHN